MTEAAGGIPPLMRTTRFAEAGSSGAAGGGCSLPLSPRRWPPSSGQHHQADASTLRSGVLHSCGRTLLVDPRTICKAATLVLQHLPGTADFARLAADGARRTAARRARRTPVRPAGTGLHNNLRAGNLRWSGGRFIPCATDANSWHPDGDAEAFKPCGGRSAEATRCRSRTWV